jgi:formate hydrogenlyase subunit 3/multisubunit Na+/H+ antiporter MnhD subunit
MIIPLIILALLLIYGIFLIIFRRNSYRGLSASSPVIYGTCLTLSLISLFTLNSSEVLLLSGSSDFPVEMIFGRFSAILIALFSLVSLSLALFCLKKKKNIFQTNLLLAFSLFGILGLSVSGNLLILFIFSAFLSITNCVIISGEGKKLYVIKLAAVNFICDLAFLTGIFLIYSVTKSFGFNDNFNAVTNGTLAGPLFIAAGICFLIASLGKSALLLLHFWLITKNFRGQRKYPVITFDVTFWNNNCFTFDTVDAPKCFISIIYYRRDKLFIRNYHGMF